MKKFNQYLSEDIIPLAQYQPDAVGIDNGPARDNINIHLANVTSVPYRTPYHALDSVRRILSTFHISLPQVTFLDGEEGHEVFTINQFGAKTGMTNSGEVVTAPDSPYHVYFEWSANDYGQFDIFCEIVDDVELEDILSDIEDEEEELEEQILYRGDSKESAKRRRIVSTLHDKKTEKILPAMQKEDYDSDEADMANHAKKFFNSPSKVIASNARKIYKDHNDKAVTGMKEEENLEERNMENKKAKDAFIARTGNAARKAGDPMHLTNKKTGIRTAVANKIRGRELSQGRNRVEEEAINEISGATARSAEHKAAKVFYNKYDAETKARANFQKEKTPEAKAKSDAAKEDRLKAGKRTMRFQQYADKKLKEETLDEVSFGLANRAAKAAENKGREADSKAYKAHLKSLNDKRLSDKGKAKAAADDIAHKETSKKKWKQASKFRDYARNKLKEETELDRWKRKYDERKKEMGHDYVNVMDKPPFDNPTEKPSTPYKNKAAKAKQLARAAMKKALEKKK